MQTRKNEENIVNDVEPRKKSTSFFVLFICVFTRFAPSCFYFKNFLLPMAMPFLAACFFFLILIDCRTEKGCPKEGESLSILLFEVRILSMLIFVFSILLRPSVNAAALRCLLFRTFGFPRFLLRCMFTDVREWLIVILVDPQWNYFEHHLISCIRYKIICCLFIWFNEKSNLNLIVLLVFERSGLIRHFAVD